LVSFSNFRVLDPEMADIARELVDDGDRRHSPFLPFILTWMGFNGWMESVTDGGSDRAMLKALADNLRMTEAYEQLFTGNEEFRRRVIAFSALWPVLNVRDVRKKLGRDAFWQFNRNELIEACRLADVRQEPAGWVEGGVPSWPQLLRTLYLIRCNLFHGAKSPQVARDRHLVRHAGQILRAFISGSGCFDWFD
jgi:hypothetical protein